MSKYPVGTPGPKKSALEVRRLVSESMKLSSVLAAVLCVASANAATIVFSQGINESQPFGVPNFTTFTTIEAIATGGTTTFIATDGGTLISPQYEVWTFAPAINNFTFTLVGTADIVAIVDFFALNGSNTIDGATFRCTGDCTKVGDISSALYASQRSADLAQTGVPEPASVSLLGAGLIGIGLMLKRKRRV
jgi:hypothetical protein